MEEGPRSEDIRAPNIYRKADLLAVIKSTRRKLKRSKEPKLDPAIDNNVQRAALRVILLEDICADFYEHGSGEKETQKMLKTPQSRDAVILGILAAIRKEFQRNMEHCPDAAYSFRDIQHFVEYGTAVMYGLIETVPSVHRFQTKEAVPAKEMAALMRKKPVSQIFSQLSNIAGKDAVQIEKVFGLNHREVFVPAHKTFQLKSFNSYAFSLENLDTAPLLVPSQSTSSEIAKVVRSPEESVYSCLAHYVEVPRTNQTMFQYLHDLMTERYCKHVLKVRTKKS